MVHFKGFSDLNIVEDLSNQRPELDVDVKDQHHIINEIFAPDPVIGKPSSDLHFMYARDKNPMVAEFIRDTLCSPVPHGTTFEDPDEAMQMMKSRTESKIEYIERITKIIES